VYCVDLLVDGTQEEQPLGAAGPEQELFGLKNPFLSRHPICLDGQALNCRLARQIAERANWTAESKKPHQDHLVGFFL